MVTHMPPPNSHGGKFAYRAEEVREEYLERNGVVSVVLLAPFLALAPSVKCIECLLLDTYNSM